MKARRAVVVFLLVIVSTMVMSGARVFAQDPAPVVIVVNEEIGVSDSGGAQAPEAITVSESIAVIDTVTVVPPLSIVVNESIGVNEQITVSDTGGVVNAAPIVDAGPHLTVDEGESVDVAASVIVLDPQLTTATVTWDDGTTDLVVPTSDGAISATHLYIEDGVYDVVITVAGLFGDQGTDSTQIEVVNLPPLADAGGPYLGNVDDAVVLTAIGSDPGDDPITYAWDLDDDGQFDDGDSQSVIFSSSVAGTFSVTVEITDDAGIATASSAEVVIEEADTSDDSQAGDGSSDDDSGDRDDERDDGKVAGRAVIGRLVSMSSSTIVVAARVGPDFTNVRVHIDSEATELAAALDAEAFTTGSKVVVVADRDVLSGNATAIRITAIPSKTSRRHERVLVAEPTAGNTTKFVSDDGSVSDSVIKDEVGAFTAGDQVVVLTHRNDSNRRDEKPRVLVNTDNVKDRLGRFAQEKFDNGDTDSSGLIDRLSKVRADDARERVDKAKKHRDPAIRDAAERADRKIKAAADKDAADPVKAIRKQAIAESEDEILECVAQILGRTVSGEGDLTADEKERVVVACLADEAGNADGGRIPEKSDDRPRDTPPPEVLACIVRILGSVPDRAISDSEKARLKAACSPGDEKESDSGKVEDRDSEREVDARKIAFCESNPADSHCTGRDTGSTGQKSDESGSEEAKRAFCAANPSDPRCAGDDRDNPGTRDESGSGDTGGATKGDSGSKLSGK